MPREDFERNLKLVQDEVVQLSSMVEKAIFKSIDSLKRRDLGASQQVIDEDDIIDAKQEAIENRCIDLIALESPMAVDLRVIIAAMMVANELERMGDYAEGIAKISLAMGELPPLKPLIDIPRMADKAVDMLRRSIESYVNRDIVTAKGVFHDDDEVDEMYEQVYRELLTYMMRDPTTIQRATYLLWVSHDLERVADRTTNIAERVMFLVTGKTEMD
ncbi:MAG: phosphate signaling complex protein PhoU [Dehalococcoidia bacterium]|jgi:phosphate transport system protein|nr:phosphate transport system regulatory protein PhoU [Chloroflexota bacterium]MCS5642818.1 phosphate signaling complex protein PhoU [Dehalococcoidia bacterium]MQG03079.1 phosphate signaling complex protein PhoU [SAR202 cluster bacterium]PKB66313.1 MAG: phosphate transport system regulatory protein PhoU [SAR202 cluster bacterium Io17-Chloro-G3]MBG91490.1 phosphate transport system regulatory protein PhoU [Chloroflexota bacterium]|tara:strand:- start:164 stop:814 length:651 start_codon:yes stop_codon:yes gene_type:complete